MALFELQASIETISAWKAIIWCFYLMFALLFIEFLARQFDDKDDHVRGKMIPILSTPKDNASC